MSTNYRTGAVDAPNAENRLGALNTNQGLVRVYRQPEEGWSGGVDARAIFTPTNDELNTYLGMSVAISGGGATMVADAPQDRPPTTISGYASIYPLALATRFQPVVQRAQQPVTIYGGNFVAGQVTSVRFGRRLLVK